MLWRGGWGAAPMCLATLASPLPSAVCGRTPRCGEPKQSYSTSFYLSFFFLFFFFLPLLGVASHLRLGLAPPRRG
ncbi:hypothetical protein TRSC58_07520 [Trypanosoma rangeli SC58]|uniref:Uncharacterized protein n=1 Tax=Trypanosoma rangeli SC58 TaxID=429131 RepID=A0A061IV41_TRYRA|nr:hypothetical protein TRSC58_07520 [Trypanosoma rangeli SC58]